MKQKIILIMKDLGKRRPRCLILTFLFRREKNRQAVGERTVWQFSSSQSSAHNCYAVKALLLVSFAFTCSLGFIFIYLFEIEILFLFIYFYHVLVISEISKQSTEIPRTKHWAGCSTFKDYEENTLMPQLC